MRRQRKKKKRSAQVFIFGLVKYPRVADPLRKKEWAETGAVLLLLQFDKSQASMVKYSKSSLSNEKFKQV